MGVAGTGPAPLVSARGVGKSLPGFGLGPVDLELEPGYVLALVGVNGSGKSTLLRMLLNLVHPDAGDLRLFGQSYASGELDIKRRIGYVPDVSVGHEEMDAVALGQFVGHWYPTWDAARYERLLQDFQVDTRKRFQRLSKGMRRRVSVAVALATRAQLLILDEPTESLDPVARRVVLDAITAHVQDGQGSVVLATHIAGEVRDVADYVAFLHGGRFLGMHEKDELMQNWKAMWVTETPEFAVPGMMSAQAGEPCRLVTRAPAETRAALDAGGLGVLRTAALELDEILAHLTWDGSVLASNAGDRGGRP